MEEEWMRDRAQLRDLLGKTPHASRAANWPRSSDALSLGSRNGASDWQKVIPMTPLCCVLVHGHMMRPTSAGIGVSRRDCGDALGSA